MERLRSVLPGVRSLALLALSDIPEAWVLFVTVEFPKLKWFSISEKNTEWCRFFFFNLLTNKVASWRVSEPNKHGGQSGGEKFVLIGSKYEENYTKLNGMFFGGFFYGKYSNLTRNNVCFSAVHQYAMWSPTLIVVAYSHTSSSKFFPGYSAFKVKVKWRQTTSSSTEKHLYLISSFFLGVKKSNQASMQG